MSLRQQNSSTHLEGTANQRQGRSVYTHYHIKVVQHTATNNIINAIGVIKQISWEIKRRWSEMKHIKNVQNIDTERENNSAAG